jgi:hypothetical protein
MDKATTRLTIEFEDGGAWEFADPHWRYGDGHSGTGWYVSEAEYPDEGSVFVGSQIKSYIKADTANG